MQVYLAFSQKSGSKVWKTGLAALQPKLLPFLVRCDPHPHYSGWQLELQQSRLHSTNQNGGKEKGLFQ